MHINSLVGNLVTKALAFSVWNIHELDNIIEWYQRYQNDIKFYTNTALTKGFSLTLQMEHFSTEKKYLIAEFKFFGDT